MAATGTENDTEPESPTARAGTQAAGKRAVVVGASSGIGAALVRQLAADGYRVGAVARRTAELAALAEELGTAVVPLTHDVVAAAEVSVRFESLVRELGGLDLLIYAAGIMPKIAQNEYDTEKDLAQVAVNLGGCIAWCNAAARLFQTQRSGTIIGVSSIAGDRGRKGNPVYCTTKAAMNTYLEALRNRLSEVGVHVCTVKPGFVDTVMTREMDDPLWLISADEAARQILKAGRRRANTRYVPRRWWLVGTVIRSIPSFLFKKLNV